VRPSFIYFSLVLSLFHYVHSVYPVSSPLHLGLRSSRCGLRLIPVGLDFAALPLNLLLDDELVLVQCFLNFAVRHLTVLHLQFELYIVIDNKSSKGSASMSEQYLQSLSVLICLVKIRRTLSSRS